MALTVLSVAYPLAPVSDAAVGGAEQVLATLDRALIRAGHRSIVVAQAGSRVAGELVPIPAPAGPLDGAARLAAQESCRQAITSALARNPGIDIIHLHGIDFESYLPPRGPPVLATLHLPPSWYGPRALAPERPNTWLHCVSASQHAACPPGPHLLPPILNGVDVAFFAGERRKRRFALMLGRICPEKGVHLAIEAARGADIPLGIAGQVFDYESHLDYMRQEVEPRLDRRRRLLGPVGPEQKRRLLQHATCLLVPSLAPETSSLVAGEAMAAGTPVIAFPNGALSEAIEDGRTGFLVEDVPSMARAIGHAGEIDPAECRRVARDRFSAAIMVSAYLDLYGRLAAGMPS